MIGNDVIATMPDDERPTLERFRELRERSDGALSREDAKGILRELKAVGGYLRAGGAP